ncbi:hypothetical protein [Pedobacter miscanthi]|jgi:uncharacterized membrane protein YkoI|uniref:hypothetical protein n=1 Tax=Pedobacter miscanthi TaxID=2259170 RepID=UPI002930605E|nr:hypothetical protein [Pedobacter miscanthi]
MKSIFGIVLLAGGTVFSSQAQKINALKVPAAVSAAFKKLHPAAKVKWEMEQANYEAGFNLNGKETSEVYTPNGTLQETETEIKSTELPAAVLAKLKGMTVAEAAKIRKADGTIHYEAEVKGKDFLFDVNGNRVKN